MVDARGGRLGLSPPRADSLVLRMERVMPLLRVKMIEGVFTPKQKQDMIQKLTDTMVSIEGENMRPCTMVILEEVKSVLRGIGGKTFTTFDVKALAAGNPKG
jgi:4-oxalocrotonate tautomerase